jgi:PIN domain nuclease of toxin-antitoxin system
MMFADPKLGSERTSIIEDANNTIFVSAVSIFEITNKVRLGKLPIADEAARRISDIYAEFDFRPLPITHLHARHAGFLPGPHRDPFDRLLAAQSILEKLPLMSGDQAFKGFGVDTVW